MSLWDHKLTLKNPSMKENRWSGDVCQLIAPRWKTQLAILPQPTDLGREKDIEQGLWKAVPIQEPALDEEFIIPVSSPLLYRVKTLERTAQLCTMRENSQNLCRIFVKT